MPPNCVEAPTAIPARRLRRGRRAEAGRAVAGREDRASCADPLYQEVGLLARRVVAVVVGCGVAVGVRRHVDPVPRGEQVAELRREVEGEVDVSERSALRLRGAADDGAGIGPAAGTGLRARSTGEVGEARREAVDDALADDVGRGQRAVALDRGVVVARPGEHLAGAERERVTEGLRAVREAHDAARKNRLAVGDEVEKAAREVVVAVAVHVAVRRRRGLRHRLLVAELVVVVEVDVDRVVDAGRVRIGDEDRRALAEELEQMVVRMARRCGRCRTSSRPSGTCRSARPSRPAR